MHKRHNAVEDRTEFTSTYRYCAGGCDDDAEDDASEDRRRPPHVCLASKVDRHSLDGKQQPKPFPVLLSLAGYGGSLSESEPK